MPGGAAPHQNAPVDALLERRHDALHAVVQERERARGGVHAPTDAARPSRHARQTSLEASRSRSGVNTSHARRLAPEKSVVVVGKIGFRKESAFALVAGTLERVLLLLRRRVHARFVGFGFGFKDFGFRVSIRALPPPALARGRRARRALVVLVRGRHHAEAPRVLHAPAHHSFVALLEHVQRDLLPGDHRVEHEQRQLHRVRGLDERGRALVDGRLRKEPTAGRGGAARRRAQAASVLAVERRKVQRGLAVPRVAQRVVQEALAQVRERGVHRPLVRTLVVQRRAARRARALSPGLAHPLGQHATREGVPARRGDGIDEQLAADGARQRVQERLAGNVSREAGARRVRLKLGGVHGLHPGDRPRRRPRAASHRRRHGVIRRRRSRSKRYPRERTRTAGGAPRGPGAGCEPPRKRPKRTSPPRCASRARPSNWRGRGPVARRRLGNL